MLNLVTRMPNKQKATSRFPHIYISSCFQPLKSVQKQISANLENVSMNPLCSQPDFTIKGKIVKMQACKR